MAKIRFNRNFDVNRVVKRLVQTVLALYVGGTVMSTFGTVMTNTTSPFYNGLSLIGWTVGNTVSNGTSPWVFTCDATKGVVNSTITQPTNCITSVSGSGVLAVIGIIAIAQIVTEFINW